MRRQFQMPEEDEEILNASGMKWETVKEGEAKWLILPEYGLPAGFNHRVAGAAFRIPPSYPDAAIDMVYFFPGLALSKGKPIGALSVFRLDGKDYQQWSRHRTAQNPWRKDVDNIGTHLVLVRDWLNKEIGK
jgi:hypothetical protein